MRALNIVGGSIVLICVVAVSYSHTLALFGMGGFTGIFQHMAVIAVEVTFLLGALNMVVSRFKGRHPGIPAIIGGLFGVGIVGWGNIEAGVNYGIHGVLLGAAIPISLIIAEAILSKAILQRMKDHPEVTQDGELSPSDSPNQWEDSQESNYEGELPPITTQETSTEQKESPKNNPVPPIDNEESTREEKETTQEEKNITQAITNESPKDLEETEESPSDTNESPSDSPKAPTITQASTNEAPKEREEPPKDLEEKETAQAITQESPTIETDPEIIYAVAWEMYQQSGEPPTRRGLAEAVPTSEHRARTAITRLKAELEQMQREVAS